MDFDYEIEEIQGMLHSCLSDEKEYFAGVIFEANLLYDLYAFTQNWVNNMRIHFL
jgi:hypothetical protein